MIGAAAAFALVWSFAFAPSAQAEDPVAYEAVIAAEAAAGETAGAEAGSEAVALTPEQQALMEGDADWSARATPRASPPQSAACASANLPAMDS